MHALTKLAFGSGILLCACREPTAPEAREIVRSVEKRIVQGDPYALSTILMFMGTVGQVHGMPMAQNEALEIVRDGMPSAINGFVVEEILLAPRGIGKPLVRRSVIGWPNAQNFLVYAFSDAHPGTLRPPTESEPHQSFSNLLLQLPGDTLGSWVPQSGTVDIGEATIDRECGQEKQIPSVPHPAERVQCHFAMFEVAVRGELLTLGDHRNPALRSFQHRHRLEVPRQRLPGIRFVTTCAERPDLPDLEEFDCLEPVRFWRDNTQYAPVLGVDIAQMELARLPQSRWRAWAQGREISGVATVPRWYTREERGTGARPPSATAIRWTMHAPDGRLIESGVSTPDDESGSRRNFLQTDYFRQLATDVRRVQLIVPAQDFDPAASPYMVSVITAEFTNP